MRRPEVGSGTEAVFQFEAVCVFVVGMLNEALFDVLASGVFTLPDSPVTTYLVPAPKVSSSTITAKSFTPVVFAGTPDVAKSTLETPDEPLATALFRAPRELL
jgi:hypothetical protein